MYSMYLDRITKAHSFLFISFNFKKITETRQSHPRFQTCETLRCAIPGRGCVTDRKPPAEGTPCGEKRVNYRL